MNTEQIETVPPDEPSQGLLPPFSTRQYSHLPTPQSPNNFARYTHGAPHSPQSPVPHSHHAIHRRLDSEGNAPSFQPNPQQCITPDSSPHVCHNSHSLRNSSATPRYIVPPTSSEFSTPRQRFSVNSVSDSLAIPDVAELRMVTPSSPSPEQLSRTSALSSPFMAKLSIAEANAKKHVLATVPQSIENDNAVSSLQTSRVSTSTPPFFPPQELMANPITMAGGEMERIRQSMLEDRMVQLREAERRRPDYLKRTKRTLSEADPTYVDNVDNVHDHDQALAIGIMESPHKGRRLKLFQETSEESFEESLMAGGYGRYRTADWVRQPQPISLRSSAIVGSSNIVSLLEEAEEQPPTEREIKKRKRLAAFKYHGTQNNAKLCAVELEGKGRVLLDIMSEEQGALSSPEPVPNKKRVNNRKKKKNPDTLILKRSYTVSEGVDDQGEKPNWPDTEFPWRLRTEERIELAKAEEEERMRWIERFLDRDSDDEGDLVTDPQHQHDEPSSPHFDLVYENGPDEPFPMGRGKMVPLLAYSDNTPKLSKRVTFPSDPADARTALMSKRSVRALSYRQQKRQRELDDKEDTETVCICNGKDDGRELVQCDACQTWYHLQCIGIQNIAELGREEDPWFCRRCVVRSPSPLRGAESLITSEPTFVPTDDEPNVRGALDASFFPLGLQESPNWISLRTPRTPTRVGTYSDFSHSWSDSSRIGPSTPQQSSSTVRIYSSPLEGYSRKFDESPFDPTSTPSRGIKFHAPFTPKNNAWPPRTSLFHSPSRPAGRGSNANIGPIGSYQAILDDHTAVPAHDHFGRPISFDDSPIRRSKLQDNTTSRRNLHLSPRSKISASAQSYLEESPIVRSANHQSDIQDERGQARTSLEGVQRHDDTIP